MRLAQPGGDKLSLDAARKLADVLLLHVIDVGVRRRRIMRVTAGLEVIPAAWFFAWRDLGLVREVRLPIEQRERGFRGYEVTDLGRALAKAAAEAEELPVSTVAVGGRRFELRCRRRKLDVAQTRRNGREVAA